MRTEIGLSLAGLRVIKTWYFTVRGRRTDQGWSTMDSTGLRMLGLFAALTFVAGTGFAQGTAAMSGRVEDPSGATIPNTNVTVTSLETGATRTVTSDEAGNYQILSLLVGRYDIKADKTGFKAAVQTRINLVVGQQAVINLKLEVGSAAERVTVTGEPPLVNTTTSS